MSASPASRARNSGPSFSGSGSEETNRPGTGVQGSPICTGASGHETKVTISGSVVYEPLSLLADLAGSNAPAKLTDSVESFSAPAAYRQPVSNPPQPDGETARDPVTYTFEILV